MKITIANATSKATIVHKTSTILALLYTASRLQCIAQESQQKPNQMCKKEGTKQTEGLLEIVGLGDDDEKFRDRYNFEELQLESSRFEAAGIK